MQIRFEPPIQRAGRVTAPPAAQAARPDEPLDRATISAAPLVSQPACLPSLLSAARNLAIRVLASLLPPGPLPVFMSMQPDELPRAVRKAFEDPETAAAHFEQLRQIDGFSKDPDGAASAYAAAVKVTGNPDGCRPILDLVKHEASPVEALETFHSLAKASGRADCALIDLGVARKLATPQIPLAETSEHLAVLRAADVKKSDYYYSQTYQDLTPALAAVLDAPSGDGRLANRKLLVELAGCMKIDEATAQVEALKSVGEPLRSSYVKVVVKNANAAETMRGLLGEVSKESQPVAEFARFRTLLEASAKVDVAIGDLRQVRAEAAQRGLAADPVAELASRLRKADPAREDYYGSFGDLVAPLAFTLDGGAQAGERVDTMLALRVGHAPSAAVPVATRLYAMKSGRGDIESELKRVVKKFNALDGLTEVLDTAATSAEPATVVRSFRRLAEATGRLEQAATDLQACLDAAKTHGCPLEQVAGIAETLRKSDPAREDYYAKFSSLTPTLDVLLSGSPSVPELESAVDDLLKVQGKGRDAATALRHDEALRKVGCKPEERAELRAAYLDVLKKTNNDEAPLEVLTLASSTPHPAETVRLFSRLLDASGKADVALADLKLCMAASTRHKTLLSEAVSRLEPLRKNDAAREDYYGTFGDAADTLDWLLSLAPQAREAPLAGLTALLKTGRQLPQALEHEKLLATLPGDVDTLRARHLKVASQHNRDSDAELLKALEAAGRHAEPVATYDHFRAFLDLSRRPSTALDDLTLLLKASDIGETAVLIARLRKSDPALSDGYIQTSPLDDALQAVRALPDASRRKTMAAELGRLWSAENNISSAVRDMGWIAQGPIARNDVKDAARKMTEIVSRQYDVADNARTLYEKVQRADIAEDRSWLARLFFKRGPYERGVGRLIGGNRVDAASLSMVENLEKGALPGESFPKTVKRYEQIRKLESSDDYYYTPDPVKLTEVLPTVQMPMAWGSWTPQGKWESFWALAQSQQSPLIAAAIWRCMASAADEAESKARQAAFDQIASLCGDNRNGALQAYSALAESLPQGGAIHAELPQMQSLLRNQEPTVAARTYRIGHGLQSLPPASQQAAQNILGHARSGEEVDALYETMNTQVAGEDMPARIDLLGQLIAGSGATPALQGYAWLQRALKPEEKDLMAPLAGLVSVLLRNGAGLDEARDILDWVRKRAADTTVDHLPAADMLVSLSTTLLMNADIDNAKHQLAAAEARALKERLGQNGGIEVGDDTINVGGIRVPRNRA